MTGQLEEEKMQVYVRLGIRLLYKGMKGRMEGNRGKETLMHSIGDYSYVVIARKLLRSLSIKQGIKYDSPESAADIPGFIVFHKLNMDEILDPLESFSTCCSLLRCWPWKLMHTFQETFNQFFYRKLKPSAHPIEAPDDPYRLVSGADCRLMVFETVYEATKVWIKGREFSVPRLLGDSYKGEADRYVGGALAIFRLAPQDYHRFHSPVGGVIGKMTYISGEYYTVNVSFDLFVYWSAFFYL
jgi:phosphatidylserine decarboxylase